VTVVALTGGIAAGKTTVTDVLRERGIAIVDADVLARDAVAPGSPGLSRVVEALGPGILTEGGELDRAALGQKVFGDHDARERLNQIVHPEVHRLSHEAFRAHEEAHPEVPLVYAVPLLVESGRSDEFDAVVVVHTPRDERIQRLVEHRGMDLSEATTRVDAQANDEQRLEAADCVLDSAQSQAHTERSAQALADALWSVWPHVERLPRSFP